MRVLARAVPLSLFYTFPHSYQPVNMYCGNRCVSEKTVSLYSVLEHNADGTGITDSREDTSQIGRRTDRQREIFSAYPRRVFIFVFMFLLCLWGFLCILQKTQCQIKLLSPWKKILGFSLKCFE